MSFNQNDRFQSRLQRLQHLDETRRAQIGENPILSTRSTDPLERAQRLRLAAAFLTVAAAAGGGLYYTYLTNPMLFAMAPVAPEAAPVPVPAEQTAAAGPDTPGIVGPLVILPPRTWNPGTWSEPRRSDRLGYEYAPGVAAAADGAPIAVSAIATGHGLTGPDTSVAQVTMFDANADCRLRPVGAGEKLVNVNIRGSDHEAPLQVIDGTDIRAPLEQRAAESLQKRTPLGPIEAQRGLFGAIDLYVTDTSAPLYLALQTYEDNVLWNIHAAPGVEIAHIAMMANGRSAITGNLGSAGVEAIRARDFGNQIDYFDGRTESEDFDCMARPFLAPGPHWTAWQGSKDGNQLDANLLNGQLNGYDAYALWYRGALGQEPDTNLVSAAYATAALIGPAPAQPFAAPAPGKGLEIRVVRGDMVLTGTATERERDLTERYRALARAAAGADLPPSFAPPEIVLREPPPEPEAAPADDTGSGSLLFDLLIATAGEPKPTPGTTFGSDRSVSVEVEVGIDELLKPGEAVPPAGDQLLYARMRAQDHMAGFCKDTMIEIAAKCRMEETEVTAKHDGRFRIRSKWAYLPAYSIGRIGPRDMFDDGLQTAFVPDTNLEETYETATARRTFLQRLLRLCDRLRPTYGSCLISTAGFYPDGPATFSPSGVKAHAAGWVSVYGLENSFEENMLQREVDALWPKIE